MSRRSNPFSSLFLYLKIRSPASKRLPLRCFQDFVNYASCWHHCAAELHSVLRNANSFLEFPQLQLYARRTDTTHPRKSWAWRPRGPESLSANTVASLALRTPKKTDRVLTTAGYRCARNRSYAQLRPPSPRAHAPILRAYPPPNRHLETRSNCRLPQPEWPT